MIRNTNYNIAIWITFTYGFVANTVSGDGEEIDAYIIGEFESLEDYVVAIINREDDVMDKL
ncbi:MAG: hypothetical protein RR950_01130, partial [Clostridium sp.]